MTKRVRFWWPKHTLKECSIYLKAYRVYKETALAVDKKTAELLWGKGNVVQLEIREVGDGSL